MAIIIRHLFGIICGLAVTSVLTSVVAAENEYYGTKIGPLSELHHGVSGVVYAVDSKTLFLKDFNYDGEGPAAYFYVGNSRRPTNEGAFRLRDERGSTGVIKRYRHKDITLSLPEGKTLRDIKWFSVWCDDFSVNFGDVTIPKNLEFPRPVKIGALKGVHSVSSDNIVIVDAQTLLIPNFSYDGEAPDAKFWVGRGSKPTPKGLRIPDENGRESPLIRYDQKTIVLTLPNDLTVFDIGHFGVWCEAFTVDFGHVIIPNGINVPPSLKMLGISPQSKLNCEVLYNDLAFEVRWAVAGESIVVQLVAKLDDGEYMSFGVSNDRDRSTMIDADVAVTWFDKKTGKGYADDYILTAKSQCSGSQGSCPDKRLASDTNSIRLLNSAMVNGYSIVTYQRPLRATDKFDSPIIINGSQAIVWAIGPLNERSETSFHSKFNRNDRFIDFGRQPVWNCPVPDGEMKMNNEEDEETFERPTQRPIAQANKREREPEQFDTYVQPSSNNNRRSQDVNRRGSQNFLNNNNNNYNEGEVDLPYRPVPTPKPAPRNNAWEIPPIQCNEPEDGVFYAQMGPTGGKQGYSAITGHVGWGISWYINGLLIPEINVVRGKTYTFVVEGGDDPNTPAKYHPFYITDDSIGGFEHKSDEEKANVRIFSGVHLSRTGAIVPTGVGRICNWTPDIDGPSADEYPSFGAYQRSLTLKCDEGEPGIITWTPDQNTPNTVYYQCFTHRYLGWKINVLDSCDSNTQEVDYYRTSASEPEPAVEQDPLLSEASIRYETKIRPNEIFLLQHEKDLIKNHNMNEQPPKIQFDLNKNSEISKIIADGIKAAEALEESISNQNGNSSYVRNENTEYRNILPTQSPYSTLSPQSIQLSNKTILSNPALSEFLRPPNFVSGPVFRPVQLAGRRPSASMLVERRPPRPHNNQYRPYALPQPSVIVNHYKKPISPFIRPFVKQQKPIKPIASFLLLGQPSDIGGGPMRKNFEHKSNKSPSILPPSKVSSAHQLNKDKSKFQYNQPPKMSIKKTDTVSTGPPQPPTVRVKPLQTKKISYKAPYEIIEDNNGARPALNSGFKPDSVIVEGGFRPIVRRRSDEEDTVAEESQMASRRRDDNIAADIDEAIEGDALFINQDIENRQFEPMFIPSPPDSINVSHGKLLEKERLTGDLIDMDIEDGDDKMAMAGERVDAYYLPPDTRKSPMLIHAQVYPEGAVVTYDGKAVLDYSLVNPLPPPLPSKNNIIYSSAGHLSKTEQLIRNTPQFGPFTGEIPPLVPDFITPEAVSQINLRASQLHQEQPSNKSQVPVMEYTNPLTTNTNPISTKLTLLSPIASALKSSDEHQTSEHHEQAIEEKLLPNDISNATKHNNESDNIQDKHS